MSTLDDRSTADQRTSGTGPSAVLTALLTVTLLVVGSAMPAAAQTEVVEGVDGNLWEPDELEIAAGTEVTFDMVGGDGAHNVVVDGEEVIPPVPIGESASYTFEEEGELDVVCTIHPGMDMVVTVSGDGGNGADGSGGDEGSEDGDTEGGDADDGDATSEDENGGEGGDAADEGEDGDAAEEDEEESAEDTSEGGDEELAAAAGDPEEGGGDTVLLISVIVAVVLMVSSFGLIRRQSA